MSLCKKEERVNFFPVQMLISCPSQSVGSFKGKARGVEKPYTHPKMLYLFWQIYLKIYIAFR